MRRLLTKFSLALISSASIVFFVFAIYYIASTCTPSQDLYTSSSISDLLPISVYLQATTGTLYYTFLVVVLSLVLSILPVLACNIPLLRMIIEPSMQTIRSIPATLYLPLVFKFSGSGWVTPILVITPTISAYWAAGIVDALQKSQNMRMYRDRIADKKDTWSRFLDFHIPFVWRQIRTDSQTVVLYSLVLVIVIDYVMGRPDTLGGLASNIYSGTSSKMALVPIFFISAFLATILISLADSVRQESF